MPVSANAVNVAQHETGSVKDIVGTVNDFMTRWCPFLGTYEALTSSLQYASFMDVIRIVLDAVASYTFYYQYPNNILLYSFAADGLISIADYIYIMMKK